MAFCAASSFDEETSCKSFASNGSEINVTTGISNATETDAGRPPTRRAFVRSGDTKQSNITDGDDETKVNKESEVKPSKTTIFPTPNTYTGFLEDIT